jgi:hypothetical protein
VFGNDGSFETIEIKSDSDRRSPAQHRRIKAAEQAVQNGGPLPGKDRRARLYDLDVPFRAHVDLLRTGTERAARDGIFAARVPGARALLVTDIYGCNAHGWADAEYQKRLDRQFSAARRRAGLGTDRDWDVSATSLDSVSRDPQRVPFAAYPLHPVACARLTGDPCCLHSGDLRCCPGDSLREAGFEAEWVRPPGAGDLTADEVVLELYTAASGPTYGSLRMELKRTLQMRRSALDRYLIELVELETWIEGMRYMLADYTMEGRPWPTYRHEDQVWV